MSDALPSPSTTPDGLEPRFSLPSTTPRSSKTAIAIGGVTIYVYGLEELKQKSGVGVGVLYLAHNRTRTYLVTEGIAHEILHRYRNDGRRKKVEMIAVTMNMRNHGDRQVSRDANLTWSGGNDNHAMDLMSMISGATQDFKLVLDFLPAYFPQFTRFHNIMLGVSLGAHTAWRMALAAQGQIEAFGMVVGCPNLTSLLLERLGIDAAVFGVKGEELETVEYNQLEKVMSEQQRRRWPRALAELIRKDDERILQEFPTDVPVFMCNGEYDKLVPSRYTSAWLERRKAMLSGDVFSKESKARLFVQENTGHSCTKEMVAMLADWLGGFKSDPGAYDRTAILQNAWDENAAQKAAPVNTAKQSCKTPQTAQTSSQTSKSTIKARKSRKPRSSRSQPRGSSSNSTRRIRQEACQGRDILQDAEHIRGRTHSSINSARCSISHRAGNASRSISTTGVDPVQSANRAAKTARSSRIESSRSKSWDRKWRLSLGIHNSLVQRSHKGIQHVLLLLAHAQLLLVLREDLEHGHLALAEHVGQTHVGDGRGACRHVGCLVGLHLCRGGNCAACEEGDDGGDCEFHVGVFVWCIL
ncbi:hypothetical protein MKX08_002692 [Trichoderma sp. CBMAI-0020]|nr:hypothetical protein MKX08_002692 [Trichoderma sp. CBMAI-0020]